MNVSKTSSTKRVKRGFSLLLSMALLFSVFTFTYVKAASEDISIVVTGDGEDAQIRSEITATITVTNNNAENMYGGGFTIEYDEEKLSLKSTSVSVDDECEWETVRYGNYIFTSADLPNDSSNKSLYGVKTSEQIVFVIKFEVKEFGGSEITVPDAIFTCGEMNDVYFSLVSANVDVNYPAKINGVSMQLGSGIVFSFSALIPDEYKGAVMHFEQVLVGDGTTTEEIYNASGKATGSTGIYQEKAIPAYGFKKPVDPHRLGDRIDAYLVYNNAIISETISYSVIEYCNFIFQNGKNAFPTYTEEQFSALELLLGDLLVYGKEAQIYENYNTSALVTSLVNDGYALKTSTFQTVTSTDKKLTEGAVDVPQINGISMTLGSNFWLTYRISAESIDDIRFKVSVNTDKEKYYYFLESDFLVKDESEDNVYYLNIKPAAKGIDYVYTVTAYDALGNEARTLSYSAKSYVYEAQDDAEVGAIVKVLYNYGKSVYNYAEVMGI